MLLRLVLALFLITAPASAANWGAVIQQYNAAGGVAPSSGFIGNDTTADEALYNVGGGSNAYCFMFTTGTAGDVNQLNVFIGNWSATDDLYGGIYSHDGANSRPLNQLGYGTLATFSTNAVSTMSLNAAVTLASSTNYWLCARATVGETYIGGSADTGGTCIKLAGGDNTLNNLPPNGSTTYSACPDVDHNGVIYADHN